MKKKLLSLTMALSIMATMGTNVFASDDVVNTTNEVVSATSVATLEVGVEQTYVNADGTEIKYFLDENLMPYIVENGENTAIILPLEHLIVTDEETLKKIELKEQINSRLPTGNSFLLTTSNPFDFYFASKTAETPFLQTQANHNSVYMQQDNHNINCTITVYSQLINVNGVGEGPWVGVVASKKLFGKHKVSTQGSGFGYKIYLDIESSSSAGQFITVTPNFSY